MIWNGVRKASKLGQRKRRGGRAAVMSDKISVLHILHELHPSGAEMMIRNAYPYWNKTCESTVMATGRNIGPFADTLKETGYEIAYVPTRGAGKKAKIVHLLDFWKYMKKHHYDVVHIHRESLSFEYALIAKMTGSRHIVRTVHSTFAHAGLQRRLKSATRWLMKHMLGGQFIAISDGVAANEEKVFGNRCDETIYNWCNNDKFSFVSAEEKNEKKKENGLLDKLVLVTVGNCGHVKNHEVLLRALAQCSRKEEIGYLHVGYAKDETEKEEALAAELGIAEQVKFLGSTDPMPYLRQADVFLMTSIYEGLSIATLEAVFTGMRVLLAEVPGLVEFKDKGLCGVDYFASTPEQLAKKLEEYAVLFKKGELVPDEAQRRRATELYDCKIQVSKYVGVYQKLAGKSERI